MHSRFKILLALTASLISSQLFAADPGKITVNASTPGVKISPMLYGLMTEEINHSYDGGLYPELIQNRTFQDDTKNPAHWSFVKGDGPWDGDATGKISLDNTGPLNVKLPTSLRLDVQFVHQAEGTHVGIANDGYWGIPVTPNTSYTASFYAKSDKPNAGPLMIAIQSADGKTNYASAPVYGLNDEWKKYSVALKTNASVPSTTKARFTIYPQFDGTLWLNLVSLTPPTFNNRPNGLRPDLMQKMADMTPSFLRLPGGNYLEGNTIAERFDWKKTIGPLESRPGHVGPWGYRSTDGLGLLEYLQWCEDLKVEPLLAVFAGYALQGEVVTGAALKPHIQDALDEIEYVTGDASTVWGARRIKDGHAAPFKLTYVEVGNEDWFDKSNSYDARFADFYDAIKAKYPKLQLIATTPVRTRKPDVLDDHYYRSARAMENDVHHYDKTSRSGPKIFVGEWASTEGSPTPTLQAALGDAAWLTGLERNSDLVVMSCYAPLLVNVNPGARQWGTNLIGYDALKSYGSPSYYAQAMFARHRGDVVLPVELVPQVAKDASPVPAPHGGIGVASWATDVEYKDLKVTKPDGSMLFTGDFSKNTDGWKFFNGDWKADDGTLHQTGNSTECRAIAGDTAWGDCDYTLKARKIGGSEGFMVMFNVKDSDNYMWFNVGGWTNTRTAVEVAEAGARRTIGNNSDFKVESNRWYDVRIETRSNKLTCFLDGKQIITATYTPLPPPDPMYAAASRDNATGDVIIKVVNAGGVPQQMEVNIQGLATVGKSSFVETLAGDPSDVNSIDQPEKVSPKVHLLPNPAPKFVHEFPPYSVNVLRLKSS